MKWLTSAPANLMIMGEHAVVAGHNAIATAINQRLTIEWETREDDSIVIQSALANHTTSLQELEDHPKLQWVMKTLQYFKPQLTTGLTLKITSEFKSTLGLGSSAAVLAATLGGIQCLLKHQNGTAISNQKPNQYFEELFHTGLAIIQAIQKRGSGTDLAASLSGGFILFNPTQQSVTKLDTAETLNLSLIYCGYKTPTAQVLEKVALEYKDRPETLAKLYTTMGALTNQAFEALSKNKLPSFYQLVKQYQAEMEALGVSDATLNQIIKATEAMPKVQSSKISGSGLGDCILTFGELNQQSDFINQLKPMNVQTDRQGLLCELIEA